MNVQNTANISYKYQPWLDTMRFIAAFLVLSPTREMTFLYHLINYHQNNVVCLPMCSIF